MQLAVFFGALQCWQPINQYFDRTLSCDTPMNRHFLAVILGFSLEEISEVLSGKLVRIGIMDPGPPYMSLEADFLPYFMNPGQFQPKAPLFRQGAKPVLRLDELGLPSSELNLLRDLFSATTDFPLHLLLYGQPGTGKSSLWKALVAEMGLQEIEVLGTGETGRSGRGAALAACVEMMGNKKDDVLVIDEAESLLVSETTRELGKKALEKAWLNDLLDRPGLRCIWVVNSTDDMDPATLRRFTYSIEMKPLQGTKRVSMVASVLRRNRLKRHFRPRHIQALAEDFDLAPAVFDSAAKAAVMAQGGAAGIREVYRRTLRAKARLLGQAAACSSPRRTDPFLPEAVNVDPGLDRIQTLFARYAKRLQGEPAGDSRPLSCLFHGMPGTGKSFTARHLAGGGDRQVIQIKASDWLNSYVGGTEQRIAGAFQDAAERGAVLIIDEIDTFLQERRAGNRIWESSMVNELLTQIDEFQGILIGTTNRMEAMDPAALRRFALKVGFFPLQPNQVVRVFRQAVRGIAAGRFTSQARDALRGLEGVTAADIFLVRNNARLLGTSCSHLDLVSEIEREVASRNRTSRAQSIGFQG